MSSGAGMESMAAFRTTSRAALHVLWVKCGLHNFRAGQLEAIEHVVQWSGRAASLVCIMATGSGMVCDIYEFDFGCVTRDEEFTTRGVGDDLLMTTLLFCYQICH